MFEVNYLQSPCSYIFVLYFGHIDVGLFLYDMQVLKWIHWGLFFALSSETALF